MCILVLIFRFLLVSAGPTCSALPVNAKDSSSSVSDGNYYLIDDSFDLYSCISRVVFILSVLIVLVECFCSPLVFRYLMTMICMGLGVAPS
jgi:hypothetical protein